MRSARANPIPGTAGVLLVFGVGPIASGPGEGVLAPPNGPHQFPALVGAEGLSGKGLVDGRGHRR